MEENKESETPSAIQQVPLQFKDTQIVYTNQIVLLGATNEEVELGICVKSIHEPAALVTHRLITTTQHFMRVADLFSQLKSDIITQSEKSKK